MAVFFGSGRQQVACDEKFSAEPAREARRRRVAAGSRGKRKGKGRGEMRGRWEMSEDW